MAKLFIGMPAHNGKRFISEAIESLLNQSYTNWEMLISDDKSNDGTEFICKEYVKKDRRITYYRQAKNIGPFNNLKFLLDKASGDYFMWTAHDDIWEKDFIKTCIENLELHPDYGVAFTQSTTINARNKLIREINNLHKLSGRANLWSVLKFVYNPEILGKGQFMYGVYRLNAALKTWEYYPQRGGFGSDVLFSLAAIAHFGVFVDKKVLVHYRLGGYSNPQNKDIEEEIIVNPKNHIFPVGGGRFNQYLRGHMEALRETPYQIPVAFLLFIRSIRAWWLFIKKRNLLVRFMNIKLVDFIPPILIKLLNRVIENPRYRANRLNRREFIDSFWKSHGGKGHEDLFMELLFNFKEKGTYVEIGTNDPAITTSFTQKFYDRGWRGINVEPGLKEFASLKKIRPEDINLNICIGGTSGEMPFYEVRDSQASSLLKDFAEKQGYVSSVRQVKVSTLKDMFNNFLKTEIDFMVIDAEGMDFEILKSNDWIRYRPRAMIVETVHHDYKEIKEYLGGFGYIDVYTNYLNSIFVDTNYFKDDPRFDTRENRPQFIQK